MATTDQICFASDEHERHYLVLMNQFADGRKGVVFVLPSTCPLGDFVFEPKYAWTSSQVTTWRQSSKAPTKLSQLPRNDRLLTVVYIAPRFRNLFNNDIVVTRPIFERLDATPTATAITAPFGSELIALIPRGAIVFDDEKRALYRDTRVREESLPCLSKCLKEGFRPQDAVVGADGSRVLPGRAEMHMHTAGEIADLCPDV